MGEHFLLGQLLFQLQKEWQVQVQNCFLLVAYSMIEMWMLSSTARFRSTHSHVTYHAG